MAIIKRLEKVILEGSAPHRPVECTYSLVNDENGRSLQIDTYGSVDRKIPGKKSQPLRFAPEAIKQLREILDSHFRDH